MDGLFLNRILNDLIIIRDGINVLYNMKSNHLLYIEVCNSKSSGNTNIQMLHALALSSNNLVLHHRTACNSNTKSLTS